MQYRLEITDRENDKILLIAEEEHGLYIKCGTDCDYGHVQLRGEQLQSLIDFVLSHYPVQKEVKHQIGEIIVDSRAIPANITFNITTTGNVVVNNKGEE